MGELVPQLIPLRGGLRFISQEANDPVLLYAHSPGGNGLQAHLAKPAVMMEEKNSWSGGTVRFYRELTQYGSQEEQTEYINTSLACAHSLYIRELVARTGVRSPILNCNALPFQWYSIKAMVRFMRTGSIKFDCTALQDMIQCAMFFRIAYLSQLMESFLRQRSAQPENVFDSYKIVFQNEQAMRCVTVETQQIVAQNMLNQLPAYLEEAERVKRSTLVLMTCNELYWLLEYDSQRLRNNVDEEEGAAYNRFQAVLLWLQFRESEVQAREMHSNANANASRLFYSVHFEKMRPEMRLYSANYLNSLSNGIYFYAALPYLYLANN